MLKLHKKPGGAKLSNKKEMIQRRIDETDPEIDRLVYELYGLTDEEIKIIENRTLGKKSMSTTGFKSSRTGLFPDEENGNCGTVRCCAGFPGIGSHSPKCK